MNFSIEGISAVVFLGASSDAGRFVEIAKSKGLQSEILTNPAQRLDLPQSVEARVFASLTGEFEEYVRSHYNPCSTLFVSLGARWIFKASTIYGLMCGNLVNMHGARLPYDAGGGGFSWRIMNSDRIDTQLVHLIDEGIDTGAVLDSHSVLLPRGCISPIQISNFYRERCLDFFDGFLTKLVDGETFERKPQATYLGRYFPRLKAPSNGWINWSWGSDDLTSFITAFDEPYVGASTLWNNQTVRLSCAHRHGGEPGSHPFMAGLVARHDKDWIVVSTIDRFSIIIEKVSDENGDNILHLIKAGDRFFTPSGRLDEANLDRVKYGPS